jgi:hypothetical protein
VPIQYGGFFGILTVEVADPGVLQQHHVELMTFLAEAIGIILWKANIFAAIHTQTIEAIDTFRESAVRLQAPMNPYKTGFISRPFAPRFVPVSLYIITVCKNNGILATTYKSVDSTRLIAEDIIRQINSSHFCVVDITNQNSNVLIELGVMLVRASPY